jgi:hypothetical protein
MIQFLVGLLFSEIIPIAYHNGPSCNCISPAVTQVKCVWELFTSSLSYKWFNVQYKTRTQQPEPQWNMYEMLETPETSAKKQTYLGHQFWDLKTENDWSTNGCGMKYILFIEISSLLTLILLFTNSSSNF